MGPPPMGPPLSAPMPGPGAGAPPPAARPDLPTPGDQPDAAAAAPAAPAAPTLEGDIQTVADMAHKDPTWAALFRLIAPLLKTALSRGAAAGPPQQQPRAPAPSARPAGGPPR